MKKLISALTALIILATTSMAEDIKEKFNPVQTAVVSQSIAPDARAGGMGDVGAATEADINSQAWNAAKYPFAISKGGIALNYTPWLRQLVNDIDLAYMAGYYRLGDYQAVSASLRYFSLGDVMVNGMDNTTIKPYELAVDAAYSRMLSEKFSAAVTFRYIYSDLSGKSDDGSKPGSAFAADLSAYYNTFLNMGSRECQLSIGGGIYNLGSKINYGDDYSYFIPTTLRLGFNYTVPINEYNRFSIAADGDAPNGFSEELEEIQWSVGAEYVYNDKFALRAGYHHEADTKGGRKYFTVGAGFKMSVFSIDAGYVISTAAANPLDQTLRVSLGFDMDGIRDLFNRGRRR